MQLARDKGLDDAWKAIDDPWLAVSPQLDRISVAGGRWAASAHAGRPSTQGDCDTTSAEAGHQLTHLRQGVQEMRDETRKLVARTSPNATQHAGVHFADSARPPPFWAAPVRAEESAPSGAPSGPGSLVGEISSSSGPTGAAGEHVAVVPQPPEPPTILDKITGGLEVGTPFAYQGL